MGPKVEVGSLSALRPLQKIIGWPFSVTPPSSHSGWLVRWRRNLPDGKIHDWISVMDSLNHYILEGQNSILWILDVYGVYLARLSYSYLTNQANTSPK